MGEELDRIEIVQIQMVKEATLNYTGQTISNPDMASEIVRNFLGCKDREVFGSLCVDTKNVPTNISTISIGSLNSTTVHPREVYKTAILSNAAGIIIFHNHPSGNPEPSQTDIDITKRIADAGDILGISLLDHIILGDSQYVSFKEKMLL